jgi:hypothetical protein
MSEPTPDREPADAHDGRGAGGPGDGTERSGSTATGEKPDAGPFGCPYCDRRFAREDWLALHEGLDHEPALSAEERAAYEAALDAEREQLRLFRYKALGALVLLYFGFVILYAVSL